MLIQKESSEPGRDASDCLTMHHEGPSFAFVRGSRVPEVVAVDLFVDHESFYKVIFISAAARVRSDRPANEVSPGLTSGD